MSILTVALYIACERERNPLMPCRLLLLAALLLTLAACGPGDSTSSSSLDAARRAASDSTSNDSNAALPDPASDPVASAQASLSLDSRAVAPVLSYAPNPDESEHRGSRDFPKQKVNNQ